MDFILFDSIVNDHVIAAGSYDDDVHFLFVIVDDGSVHWKVQGDDSTVWAAASIASFR